MVLPRTSFRRGDYGSADESATAGEGIWIVGSPILLVLGSVCNILSIAVIMRRSLKEASARFLLVILAFTDLLNLYSGLLRHWVRVGLGVDIRELSNASCKIHIFVVYFGVHFQAWLLVVITIERFVAVFLPHKSRVLFSRDKAIFAASITAGLLILINAHFFWTTFMAYDELGGYCDYMPFFDEAWVWIDLFLASLGPFAIMITLNSAIVYKLHQHHKYRRQQSITARPINTRQTKLTITLLAVSLTFFLTTLPLCVHLILVNGIFLNESDPDTLARLSLSFAVCSILAYTNNVINFFLYCLGGNRFRKELAAMCRCACCNKEVHPQVTVTATETAYPSLTQEPSSLKSLQKLDKVVGKTTPGGEENLDTNGREHDKSGSTTKTNLVLCCYSNPLASSYKGLCSDGTETQWRERAKRKRLLSRRSSTTVETLSRIQEEQDQEVDNLTIASDRGLQSSKALTSEKAAESRQDVSPFTDNVAAPSSDDPEENPHVSSSSLKSRREQQPQ